MGKDKDGVESNSRELQMYGRFLGQLAFWALISIVAWMIYNINGRITDTAILFHRLKVLEAQVDDLEDRVDHLREIFSSNGHSEHPPR